MKWSILDYSNLDCNLPAFLSGMLMEKSIHSSEYARFLALLRDTRVQSGQTQEDLVTKLNATQSFVSNCERGERRLDLVELAAWCCAQRLACIVCRAL